MFNLLGGGFGNANLETTIGSPTGSPYFSSSADIASVSQSGANLLYPNSAIAGIQFGDNFVVSRLVMVGMVLDYGYFHLNETNSASNVAYPSSSGNYSLQTSVTTNWLYTVRGRVGLMLPPSWPLLLYATGGLAVANLNVSNSFSDTTTYVGEGAQQSGQTLINLTLKGQRPTHSSPCRASLRA